MINSHENLGFYYNKQKDRNLMVRQTKKKRSTVFCYIYKAISMNMNVNVSKDRSLCLYTRNFSV